VTEYLLYLYAESPVHTGAAGSLDVLDLPVQREAATGYPVIWGQSLKGALRQAARDVWGAVPRVDALFGSAIKDVGEEGGTTPGTLAVGDAQLVAMPVPTLRRTFAWVTSSIALGRLARKYAALRRDAPASVSVRDNAGLCSSSAWTQSEKEVLGPCVVGLLRPFSQPLAAWADRIASDALGDGDAFAPFAVKLREDLVLAGSDIVGVLLRECTEQAVRVQLYEDSKTVKEGPFYSEYLPAETIMATSLTLRGNGDTRENQEALRGLLHGQLMQVGGDETLGKGLMWARLVEAQQPGARS
jgi:CRISPR-associated protein Cmr4